MFFNISYLIIPGLKCIYCTVYIVSFTFLNDVCTLSVADKLVVNFPTGIYFQYYATYYYHIQFNVLMLMVLHVSY